MAGFKLVVKDGTEREYTKEGNLVGSGEGHIYDSEDEANSLAHVTTDEGPVAVIAVE
jgi:hypothetical protein